MFYFNNIFQLVTQYLILAVTTAGWGYYFLLLLNKSNRISDIIISFIAGFSSSFIALQLLVYFDFRIYYTAWIVFFIACIGCFLWAKNFNRKYLRLCLNNNKYFILIILIISFHSACIAIVGPNNYYGYARQDHVNYVSTSQFLIEKPFSTEVKDIGLHPWLVGPLSHKNERIGPCVAISYLAVINFTDSKQSYGAVSVFYLLIVSLATLALLKSTNLSPILCTLGSLWLSVLPAITQCNLDNFLGQLSTLFCIPAITVAIYEANRNYLWSLVCTVIILSLLFGSYTEIYCIGLAFSTLLIWLNKNVTFNKKLLFNAACVFLPVFILEPTAIQYIKNIVRMYRSVQDANILSEWAPYSGTWRGWAQNYFIMPKGSALLIKLQIVLGVFVLALLILGILYSTIHKRIFLLGLISIPSTILFFLLERNSFPRYPFYKLTVCFLPIFILFVVLGTQLTFEAVKRIKFFKAYSCLSLYALIFFIFLSGWCSISKLNKVLKDGEGLATMNLVQCRKVYKELEMHPEHSYLLLETHYILNSWFCYYARRSLVYTAVDQIGDQWVGSDLYDFRRNKPTVPYWTIDYNGLKLFK